MSFIRLHIIVEGQTEEQFVKQILAPHLWEFNIIVYVQCIVTSRDKIKQKTFRGGLSKYEKVRNEISFRMKQDVNNECRFSTMFDLYALPITFPGFDKAKHFTDPYQRVKDLEKSFREDIGDFRFIPYIQLHEFEALILADPSKLKIVYLDREKQIQNLCQMIEKEGRNPELINDGEKTSPSNRIENEIPEYDKVFAGSVVTKKIGLKAIRDKCAHFNEWLNQLEALSS